MTITPALMTAAVLTLQAGSPPEACPAIEPTKEQGHANFRNAIALEQIAMRTLSGESWCERMPAGAVTCAAVDPQLVHVTIDGRHFWFKIPPGRSAIVEVEGPVPKCQLT